MADVPKFKFPFQRDPRTGKVQVVEQDSPEHVMSCDELVVRTPRGFRLERPEFGWAFPAGRTAPLNLGELEQALMAFGHTNSPASAQQWTDTANAAVQHIEVEVQTQ